MGERSLIEYLYFMLIPIMADILVRYRDAGSPSHGGSTPTMTNLVLQLRGLLCKHNRRQQWQRRDSDYQSFNLKPHPVQAPNLGRSTQTPMSTQQESECMYWR